MRYFTLLVFFLFSSVALAQVPDKLFLLREQGFLNTVSILTHDSIGGTADQSHGQCTIYLGRTKEGQWAGSLALLGGDEDALAEQEIGLATELTLWALLHENAHCLWYLRGGPANFSIKNYPADHNIAIGSVLLYHRAMSEIVLSESFADIYASILFKKIYPESGLLNKIAAARDKASSQKYDSLFDVNIAGAAIRLVARNSLPLSSSPDQLFERAAQLASHDMLADFNARSPRVQAELLSEKYFLSLFSQWWEGFAEDQECWWKGNPFGVAVLLYKEIGCKPPPPYSAASFLLGKNLRIWFGKEEQQQRRVWAAQWFSKLPKNIKF